MLKLAGEIEITTSEEIRCLGLGSMWLLDDTTGKVHNTRRSAMGTRYGFGLDLAQQQRDRPARNQIDRFGLGRFGSRSS